MTRALLSAVILIKAVNPARYGQWAVADSYNRTLANKGESCYTTYLRNM